MLFRSVGYGGEGGSFTGVTVVEGYGSCSFCGQRNVIDEIETGEAKTRLLLRLRLLLHWRHAVLVMVLRLLLRAAWCLVLRGCALGREPGERRHRQFGATGAVGVGARREVTRQWHVRRRALRLTLSLRRWRARLLTSLIGRAACRARV